jgi:hypothetical protein
MNLPPRDSIETEIRRLQVACALIFAMIVVAFVLLVPTAYPSTSQPFDWTGHDARAGDRTPTTPHFRGGA